MLRLLKLLPVLLAFLALVVVGFAAPVVRAAEPAPAPAATAPESPAPAALPVVPAPVDAAYRVGAGDTLTVTVYGEPSLSGAFPVSDSGQVDFPLLGPVAVSGSSTTEIASRLHDLLTPNYLVNPSVTVSLGVYHSQPVQVLGAVARPGTYYLHGATTVLQILSEAGGVARDGVNEVRLTHGGEAGQITVLPYDRLLKRELVDPVVAAGDVVFVPQSLISVMGVVGKPGEIAYRQGLTLSNCIAAAGGALPTADLGRVFILRDGVRTQVNLRKVLSGQAVDPVVLPGDRIFVRESPV